MQPDIRGCLAASAFSRHKGGLTPGRDVGGGESTSITITQVSEQIIKVPSLQGRDLGRGWGGCPVRNVTYSYRPGELLSATNYQFSPFTTLQKR